MEMFLLLQDLLRHVLLVELPLLPLDESHRLADPPEPSGAVSSVPLVVRVAQTVLLLSIFDQREHLQTYSFGFLFLHLL